MLSTPGGPLGGGGGRIGARLQEQWAVEQRLLERLLAEAAYHTYVTEDMGAAAQAYQAVLQQYPNDGIAANNLAVLYSESGGRFLITAPLTSADWTELLEGVSTEWIEVPESFGEEVSLAGLDFRARTGGSCPAATRSASSTAARPARPLTMGLRPLVSTSTKDRSCSSSGSP